MEEWNSQSFYISILFKDEPKVCEPDFWPQNIGYRRFFISREDQQNKTIMENKINNLVVSSLNCEGLRRSRDYIWNFLDSIYCDVLCLQETWTIDLNISMFSSIHNNYLFTCISGIDHTTDISMRRPQGGVAILYNKSLSGIIKHITITNHCLCGINITVNNSSLIFYQFICLVIITQEL